MGYETKRKISYFIESVQVCHLHFEFIWLPVVCMLQNIIFFLTHATRETKRETKKNEIKLTNVQLRMIERINL